MASGALDGLPSIRTLALPDAKAISLFSRAVLLAQQPATAMSVRPWLEQYYSEQTVCRRLLPGKQRGWEDEQRHLAAAPTEGELEWWATGNRGGWTCQQGRDFSEHLAQHRKAAKHPGYRRAVADRRARLRTLKEEQKNWRPTLKDRLLLAVNDIIEAEYPDGPEHVEHSRRIVAIAALLMPEPLPMLGELGTWPFASTLDLPDKPTGHWLDDAIAEDATGASEGPHGYRPGLLDPRKVGREEVMFVRMPGEARKVEQWFPLEDLLKLLDVAVDELDPFESLPSTRESKAAPAKWGVYAQLLSGEMGAASDRIPEASPIPAAKEKPLAAELAQPATLEMLARAMTQVAADVDSQDTAPDRTRFVVGRLIECAEKAGAFHRHPGLRKEIDGKGRAHYLRKVALWLEANDQRVGWENGSPAELRRVAEALGQLPIRSKTKAELTITEIGRLPAKQALALAALQNSPGSTNRAVAAIAGVSEGTIRRWRTAWAEDTFPGFDNSKAARAGHRDALQRRGKLR
jgi:hypothetical protein